MRFGSCFCINIIKGGFPVNMDLGNSVYLFLSIQKSVNWKFFVSVIFFSQTQRLCIVSFHKEHKPIWGQLWFCISLWGAPAHTVNLPISKQGSMLPRQAVTWHGDDRVIQSQGSRVCISSWSPLGQASLGEAPEDEGPVD